MLFVIIAFWIMIHVDINTPNFVFTLNNYTVAPPLEALSDVYLVLM